MPKKIKVYLAGPMNHCTDRQAKTWRKDFAGRLSQKAPGDYDCIDPTQATRKDPAAIAADLEGSDVVVANMWKESIGTTMQISHARRLGIPVILIDQHYIESQVLSAIIEDEYITHSEEKAVNILNDRIAPRLNREPQVKKDDGSYESFKLRVMQNSVKKACEGAGVVDPIFHIKLCQSVNRTIRSLNSEYVTTKDIKERIFSELSKLSIDDPALSVDKNEERRVWAQKVREAWEENEQLMKPEKSKLNKWIEELTEEIEGLSEELAKSEVDASNWKARYAATEKPELRASAESSTAAPSDYHEYCSNRTQSHKFLCIYRLGRTSFHDALSRKGFSDQDIACFESMPLDGKQSNLNSDLRKYLNQRPLVLYAANDLRHLDADVRSHERMLFGAGPHDVVRRLVGKIKENWKDRSNA